MSSHKTKIPPKFHSAVEKWRDTFLPDYDFLIDNWDKHFPKDPQFELCAYREAGMCTEIECGENKGKPKYQSACDMPEQQAGRLFGAIRAQASTEFGSIQQHGVTLARAQEEEDQFWVLRMMAEELRHGYQMLHVILEDDWSAISGQSSEDTVEEILSMKTGSHVLSAFNIDFDSFSDNIVFCALVDRVGKYQLAMQKISSYQPMAESMPQMLREEAFHLATGVIPMRRWVEKAAQGSVTITMHDLQLTLNKWVPRALEMFGDERGGGSNVRDGLKPMKNLEAQSLYLEEIDRLIQSLNMRFVRARLPEIDRDDAEKLISKLLSDGGSKRGIAAEDLLRLPHRDFYRRRGVAAFEKVGVGGERIDDVDEYKRHLAVHLGSAYRAGSDFQGYLQALAEVEAGTLTVRDASMQMPELRRVGGSCPCSKSVRWVAEAATASNGTETATA